MRVTRREALVAAGLAVAAASLPERVVKNGRLKQSVSRWPYQAIPLAGSDGNPATVADPSKLPTDPTRSPVLNPNQFYVFAFSDDELPGYVPHQFQALNSNGR